MNIDTKVIEDCWRRREKMDGIFRIEVMIIKYINTIYMIDVKKED